MRRPTTRTPRSARHRTGFSLVELMTVVGIIGVLAAIAIPTFSDYIYKSRASEATEFLGVIKLREESYRSEYGAYASTVGTVSAPSSAVSDLATMTNLVPDPTTTGKETGTFVPTALWQALGAVPSGAVRFGYGVVAGTPAALPANYGFTPATADFWYIAQAVGNLDGDSTYVTFESCSACKGIYICDSSGAPISKGWE